MQDCSGRKGARSACRCGGLAVAQIGSTGLELTDLAHDGHGPYKGRGRLRVETLTPSLRTAAAASWCPLRRIL